MNGLPAVVKVGGSLFDLPDLGPRLRHFLGTLHQHVLIVPGGGSAADAVRELDQCHGLGEEACHWLALRAMTLNAHFLAALLPPTPVIADPQEWLALGGQDARAILDSHAFACLDERDHPHRVLPHCWSATSDSFAVRLAGRLRAARLFLLKSVTMPGGIDWKQAVARGWVDEVFPLEVEQVGTGLSIAAVNFRTWEMGTARLD